MKLKRSEKKTANPLFGRNLKRGNQAESKYFEFGAFETGLIKFIRILLSFITMNQVNNLFPNVPDERVYLELI